MRYQSWLWPLLRGLLCLDEMILRSWRSSIMCWQLFLFLSCKIFQIHILLLLLLSLGQVNRETVNFFERKVITFLWIKIARYPVFLNFLRLKEFKFVLWALLWLIIHWFESLLAYSRWFWILATCRKLHQFWSKPSKVFRFSTIILIFSYFFNFNPQLFCRTFLH